MKTLRWLVSGSLVLLLGACAPATTELETDSATPSGNSSAAVAEPEASNDRLSPVPEALSVSSADMRDCATTNYGVEPLARGKNEAIFNQFNFRPQSVKVFADTVAVETPDYTFYYCASDENWVPLANEEEVRSPEERWYNLGDFGDPDYQSIEVNGEVYEYRTRLDADWIDERSGSTEEIVSGDGNEPSEDTVSFEMTLPDGEKISQVLYTTSELREAGLGYSLGVPDTSGAAIADGKIWVATTAEQGEGNSGFASLVAYDLKTGALSVEQPEALQGDQINAIAATEAEGEVTLWLGTQRAGEGTPFFPASGLVGYRPESGEVEEYAITNSPLVGAIPYALTVEGDRLWVATGDGPCRVQWQRIEVAKSWECWRVAPIAEVPGSGVAVYDSFLATEAEAELDGQQVEVLWAAESYGPNQPEGTAPEVARYEVVYEPGFEATLSQGGYRVADAAAKRAVAGEPIFWPGRQWHWAGDRFRRGLDEVSLNYVGGGPYGLVTATTGSGLRFDHRAIRGAFDLLELTPEGTKVKYYSGWVDADELEVRPRLVPVERSGKMKPNPLTKMASDLPNSGP